MKHLLLQLFIEYTGLMHAFVSCIRVQDACVTNTLIASSLEIVKIIIYNAEITVERH